MDDETARERIVEAADELFYAQGIQAVGMDAIRSAAGVSLKRMYRLFASKDELLVEVLRRRRERWDSRVEAAVARAGTPRDRVLAVFDFLDDWSREPDFRGCGFLYAFGEVGAHVPAVARASREQKDAFAGRVAELVAEAGVPAYVAPQITLLAEGALAVGPVASAPHAPRTARDAAATLLDAALAVQGTGAAPGR